MSEKKYIPLQGFGTTINDGDVSIQIMYDTNGNTNVFFNSEINKPLISKKGECDYYIYKKLYDTMIEKTKDYDGSGTLIIADVRNNFNGNYLTVKEQEEGIIFEFHKGKTDLRFMQISDNIFVKEKGQISPMLIFLIDIDKYNHAIKNIAEKEYFLTKKISNNY